MEGKTQIRYNFQDVVEITSYKRSPYQNDENNQTGSRHITLALGK